MLGSGKRFFRGKQSWPKRHTCTGPVHCTHYFSWFYFLTNNLICFHSFTSSVCVCVIVGRASLADLSRTASTTLMAHYRPGERTLESRCLRPSRVLVTTYVYYLTNTLFCGSCFPSTQSRNFPNRAEQQKKTSALPAFFFLLRAVSLPSISRAIIYGALR